MLIDEKGRRSNEEREKGMDEIYKGLKRSSERDGELQRGIAYRDADILSMLGGPPLHSSFNTFHTYVSTGTHT